MPGEARVVSVRGVLAAGADVWRGRWIVVVLGDGRFERAFLAADLAEVVGELPDVAAIGVDIPIGLPDAGGERLADGQARRYVGPRWQSVFVTPSLAALQAPSLAAANRVACAEGSPGVSAQTYALRTHILRAAPVAAGDQRVHEVHPEVSFVAAGTGRLLPWPKASWSGLMLRRRILAEAGVVLPDELGGAGGAGAADVLDAAVVAWSADRIARGVAEPLPAHAGRSQAIWR